MVRLLPCAGSWTLVRLARLHASLDNTCCSRHKESEQFTVFRRLRSTFFPGCLWCANITNILLPFFFIIFFCDCSMSVTTCKSKFRGLFHSFFFSLITSARSDKEDDRSVKDEENMPPTFYFSINPNKAIKSNIFFQEIIGSSYYERDADLITTLTNYTPISLSHWKGGS